MAKITPEIRTARFFGRPADLVVSEFAAGVYEKDGDKVTITAGKAKILQIDTAEGLKDYRVELAEAYLEQNATRIWKGKRAAEIHSLNPGETITYRSRSGELTFIKTTEADNILIRGLTELGTERAIITPSEVTKTLGLTHGATGRLTFVEKDRFRFIRT